jgi:hypothetical protein
MGHFFRVVRPCPAVDELAIGLGHAPAIQAQWQGSASALPHFEVASRKPGGTILGDKININLGALSHGTLMLTNASLADCLSYAYGLTDRN